MTSRSSSVAIRLRKRSRARGSSSTMTVRILCTGLLPSERKCHGDFETSARCVRQPELLSGAVELEQARLRVAQAHPTADVFRGRTLEPRTIVLDGEGQGSFLLRGTNLNSSRCGSRRHPMAN